MFHIALGRFYCKRIRLCEKKCMVFNVDLSWWYEGMGVMGKKSR